jgi:hypothetical protein
MEKNQNKLQTSNVIFETTINCFFTLKPARPGQFSRQIVIQILGMASPKVGISQYVHFSIRPGNKAGAAFHGFY